ncbi:8579_t:CDS:1, partial [Gigaspora rosea]
FNLVLTSGLLIQISYSAIRLLSVHEFNSVAVIDTENQGHATLTSNKSSKILLI